MFTRVNAVDTDARSSFQSARAARSGGALLPPPIPPLLEPHIFKALFRAVRNLAGGHPSIEMISRAAEMECNQAPFELLDCARRYGRALSFYAGYLAPVSSMYKWSEFTAFERTFRYWLVDMAPGLQPENLWRQPEKRGTLPAAFASNPNEFTQLVKNFTFAGAVCLVTAPLEEQVRAIDHRQILRSICRHGRLPDEVIRNALKLDLEKVGSHLVWAAPIVRDGMLRFLRAVSSTEDYGDNQNSFERPIRYLRQYSGWGIGLFGKALVAFSGEELCELQIFFSHYGDLFAADTWRKQFATEVREVLPNVRPFISTYGETGTCLVKALGLSAFHRPDRIRYIVNAVRDRFQEQDTLYDFNKTLEALTPGVVNDTTDTALQVYLASGSRAGILRSGLNLFLANETVRREVRWITECAGSWAADALSQYPLGFLCVNPAPIRRLVAVTRRGLIFDALSAVSRSVAVEDGDIIDEAIHFVGSHAWGALEGGGEKLIPAFRDNPAGLRFILDGTGAGAGHFFAKVPLEHWFSAKAKGFIERYGEAAGKEFRARSHHPEVEDNLSFREVAQDNKRIFGIHYPSRYCEEDLTGRYCWDLLEENLETLKPDFKCGLPPCVVLVSRFDDREVLKQIEMIKQLRKNHKVFIFEVGSPAEIDAARRLVTSIVLEGGNPLDDRARVLIFSHGNVEFLPLSTPPDLQLPDETHDLNNADWALTKDSIGIFSHWGDVLLPPGSRLLAICCNSAKGGRGGNNFWRRLKQALPDVYINGSRIASAIDGLRYDRLNRPISIAFSGPRRTQVLG